MAVSVVSFSFSWCSTGWWLSLLHLISIFSGPQLIRAPRSLRPDVAFLTTSHLKLRPISNWSPSEAPRPLRPDVALPTTSHPSPSPTLTGTVWLLSLLSYIIVQRPLNRLLDLWNRMLDRRQVEITVMQFRGHSLPVRQSMSVPWEIFYLVPFHQPISAHAISSHNCH